LFSVGDQRPVGRLLRASGIMGQITRSRPLLQQFPVDLIHSVVVGGLDPRIHHLCEVSAKKMDPRVTAVDGSAPTQIDRELQ
jgi:hypothetical protein